MECMFMHYRALRCAEIALKVHLREIARDEHYITAAAEKIFMLEATTNHRR